MEFENFPGKAQFEMTQIKLPNPLDPRTALNEGYTLIQPEIAPVSGKPRTALYSAYIPPKLFEKYKIWAKSIFAIDAADKSFPQKFPVNLSLFFCAPGNDLGIETLGLQYFLQNVDDTFVIVIPNFETHKKIADPVPKNVGITTAIINKILDSLSMNHTPSFIFFDIKITCATAYSSGNGGLVQSINNELFDTSNLKKIVFYDCLQRVDGPPLPKGEKIPALFITEQNNGPDEVDLRGHARSAYNTRRAIAKVQKINKNMEVIAYAATAFGSPKYLQDAKDYTVSVDRLIDLRLNTTNPHMPSPNLSRYLLALTLTRTLMMARDENPDITIPKAFLDLSFYILPRGQIASSATQQKQSNTGFRPNTTLEAWGKKNQLLIDKLNINDVIKTIVMKHNLFYPGYPKIEDPEGGMLHIAQIFEFAGEEFI